MSECNFCGKEVSGITEGINHETLGWSICTSCIEDLVEDEIARSRGTLSRPVIRPFAEDEAADEL